MTDKNQAKELESNSVIFPTRPVTIAAAATATSIVPYNPTNSHNPASKPQPKPNSQLNFSGGMATFRLDTIISEANRTAAIQKKQRKYCEGKSLSEKIAEWKRPLGGNGL